MRKGKLSKMEKVDTFLGLNFYIAVKRKKYTIFSRELVHYVAHPRSSQEIAKSVACDHSY
jgi:hypothetical protein